MNGNKYENIKWSIDSRNSHLGALTFLCNSFKKIAKQKIKKTKHFRNPKVLHESIMCNITRV